MDSADFINHSCDPNCGIRGHLLLFARSAIAMENELTFDYGTVFVDHGRGRVEMSCSCRAAACRGLITSEDWQEPAFRRRHRGDLSFAVQERIAAAFPDGEHDPV
ncbi:MAG: SET domain-containing protein-lysine N-methyltransferase [Nannocystis sp.]|nr:SET domain-containing protein-lysine N-methyltransferase [Nannocystis sp.]